MPSTDLSGYEVTRRLANVVSTASMASLASEVVPRARMSFADAFGAMLLGSLERGPSILSDFVRDHRGNPTASVVGHGYKTTPDHAAWVNGTAADSLGLADFSVAHMNHPSAAICPAVLALGEHMGSHGGEVMLAYVLGVEISNRIANAVKPGFHRKGWHALGVCNVFGAAAAASRLLNLDTEETANAFGIAGSQASGVKASMVTMTKSYVAGTAARDGICAALLAKRGFTGPADIFEARDGFFQTFGDGADPEALLVRKASLLEFVDPGLALKAYPSCTHTHTAIHATLGLMREHGIGAADVVEVLCSVTPVAYEFLAWTEPRSAVEAKFSMQYCVATALLEGRVGLSNFSDEGVRAPGTIALMQRIRMIVSPELAARGYNPPDAPSGCSVRITLNDGRVVSATQDRGPWEPESPPSWDEWIGKYRMCAGARLDQQRLDASAEALARLETIERVDELMAIARC